MNKRIVVILCLVMVGIMLTGCSRIKDRLFAFGVPEVDPEILDNLSEKYLVGISSVGGEGPRYEFMSEDSIVTKDGRFIYKRGGRILYTDDLDPEAFAAIEAAVDPETIMKMTVESMNDVCDGSSRYIYLYNQDEDRVFSVGGYMPVGSSFQKLYDVIQSNIRDSRIAANRVFTSEIEAYMTGFYEYMDENLPDIQVSWELMEDLWKYDVGIPVSHTDMEPTEDGNREFTLFDNRGNGVLVVIDSSNLFKESRALNDTISVST